MVTIGMQLNETMKIAVNFNNKLRKYFGNRLDNFSIFNVVDDLNRRAFSVEFEAYNYFCIRINYDKGRLGCCIMNGNTGVLLENSQKWFEEADFNIFFQELKDEIELRIPDKFLMAHGWE